MISRIKYYSENLDVIDAYKLAIHIANAATDKAIRMIVEWLYDHSLTVRAQEGQTYPDGRFIPDNNVEALKKLVQEVK